MPTPRRFTQTDISEIWLDLCTDSTREIARRRGVNVSTILQITNDKSYRLETERTDSAVLQTARAAMKLRGPINASGGARSVKREAPSKDMLLAVLSSRGSQRSAGLLFGCSVDLIREWMALRGIKTTDYKSTYKKYSKLEFEDIPLIRQLHLEGQTIDDIAVTFDVLPITIGHVLTGDTWGKLCTG